MAIKHVGYAIQDKNENLIANYRDVLIFEEKFENLNALIDRLNQSSIAPCRVVRVLIDDDVNI